MNSPLRVFVIEDSPILLERIAEAIADQPSLILVGSADCEADAIAKIRELKPEALVVDIKLREGNGLNVLAQLKLASAEGRRPPEGGGLHQLPAPGIPAQLEAVGR